MSKTPYPHQTEAVQAVYNYWPKPESGDGLLVVPTGGGKSFILSMIIADLSKKWPGTRILVITHVKELIEQDYDELKELWPEAPAGIFSAGLGRKELHADILIAGVQSLEKHTARLDPAPDIVIIDEAHLIPRNDNTRYQKIIKTLKVMNPKMRLVGLTATPYRLDSGMLHKGDGAIFNDIIYEIDIQYLIDKGLLVPIISRGGSVKIDTEGVHKRGGEFIPGELETAAMKGDTTEQAVSDLISRGADRKSWLIFTTGIDHAYQVRDCLEKHGIPCEAVTGDTPTAKRAKHIEDHKSGQLRAVVCVDTLTTGYNNRRLDLIGCLRPTGSPGLWVQMLGRGTRVFPGKKNCLLLDYTDNSIRFGPIDDIHPEAPNKGDGLAPCKECPECSWIMAAGCRVCPDCGFVFPEPEKKITRTPTEAPILKSQVEPKTLDVIKADYFIHKKDGRPDSVRIEYQCGLYFVKEWVFPQAESEKNDFYYRKFLREAGAAAVPRSAADFCANPPPKPARITIVKDGKFDRVIRREYAIM